MVEGKSAERFGLACRPLQLDTEDGHAENVVKGSFHCAPLSVSNVWNLRISLKRDF